MIDGVAGHITETRRYGLATGRKKRVTRTYYDQVNNTLNTVKMTPSWEAFDLRNSNPRVVSKRTAQQ